jgi:hypothetical protein
MQLQFPGRIAGAIGILLVLCAPASAKDLCISFSGSGYFANTSIPAKNQCKPLYLFAEPATDLPGFLATGAICLASDAETVLLSTSDGYFSAVETESGTWNKSTGLGSSSDCVASTIVGIECATATLTVTSCSSQPIPAAVFDPSLALVRRSMSD